MIGELIVIGLGLPAEAPRTELDGSDPVRQQLERLTPLVGDLAQTSLSCFLALRLDNVL